MRSAGIYEPSEECKIDDMDNPEGMMQNCIMNVCQPGNRLKCAGYVLYSCSTMLVLTLGDGVYGFTLDWQIGEFVLTHDRIQIPEEGKIYSFNEGNYAMWDEGVRKYMDSLKLPEKWGGKPYSVRSCSEDSLCCVGIPWCSLMHYQWDAGHALAS
jgi:fructose-1,6-bisphosphatase I